MMTLNSGSGSGSGGVSGSAGIQPAALFGGGRGGGSGGGDARVGGGGLFGSPASSGGGITPLSSGFGKLFPSPERSTSGYGSKSKANVDYGAPSPRAPNVGTTPPRGPSSSSRHGNRNGGTAVAAAATVEGGYDAQASPSVSLSCISPDGRSVHMLLKNERIREGWEIRTRSLVPKEEQEAPVEIQTELTADVTACLAIDDPMELLCVDNESPSLLRTDQDEGNPDDRLSLQSLPLLCLYTKKSAFLLRISARRNSAAESLLVGQVEEVLEPFESFLVSGMSNVVRIRSAPQESVQCPSFVSICPRGAMAMLTDDGSIYLYHGLRRRLQNKRGMIGSVRGNLVTMPFKAHLSDQTFTDFTFRSSPSTDSPMSGIFPTLSILLATSAGYLYGASPIVFDGMIVPRRFVATSLAHLDGEIDHWHHRLNGDPNYFDEDYQEDPNDAPAVTMLRHFRAARQLLLDTFGTPANILNTGGGVRHVVEHYLTAKISSATAAAGGNTLRSATSWPVQLQGPLSRRALEDGEEEEERDATPYQNVLIENMGCEHLSLGGAFVLCHTRNRQLSIGVLSPDPSLLLPRFAFESADDAYLLNRMVAGFAGIAETVKVVEEEEEGGNSDAAGDFGRRRRGVHNEPQPTSSLSLLVDPVEDDMIHLVSDARVATISTNVVDLMSQRLANEQANSGDEYDVAGISTNVWSSISVANKASATFITGAVISGDAHIGHTAVACMSSGITESVDVKSTKMIHESSSLSNMVGDMSLSSPNAAAGGSPRTATSPKDSEDDGALENAMSGVRPLHEVIGPYVASITSGLSAMSKVVASPSGGTKLTEADPAAVAVALSVKKRCEEGVITPLTELREIVASRKSYLRDMYKNHMTQLDLLEKLVTKARDRMEKTEDKLAIAASNFDILANRSEYVLEASRSLSASVLTDAERSYFEQLRRLDTNCTKWEKTLGTMQGRLTTLRRQEGAPNALAVDLLPSQITVCRNILRGEDAYLKKNERRLLALTERVQTFMMTNSQAVEEETEFEDEEEDDEEDDDDDDDEEENDDDNDDDEY